jgi:hypothetical protein
MKGRLAATSGGRVGSITIVPPDRCRSVVLAPSAAERHSSPDRGRLCDPGLVQRLVQPEPN